MLQVYAAFKEYFGRYKSEHNFHNMGTYKIVIKEVEPLGLHLVVHYFNPVITQ